MANEGVLTERRKFAQMKQEPHESVTPWEERVKEQGGRLDCEDQLLRDKFKPGINNERLMSKLLDKGHRDKATKEITPFKTVLQIAKNFEQCEKAKAVMQKAKSPTEQVNYAGARKPPKSEQNWGKAEDERGARVGRKFFSHLKLGLTKDMTKPIRIQLDTAFTCHTLPENLSLSLIPPGKKLEDFVTPSRATLFTYDNSKLPPLGKLELLAETATGYHLLTFHIFRDSQIPGKPPLLSDSDCVHLGLVKICANEVHSVSSPLRPVNVKPHLMADISRPRDIPRQPEPTSSPRVSNVTHSSTTGPPRPPTLTMKWILGEFQDVHPGLGQLGRSATFDMNPTVKPVHYAIHRQPVARQTKIKEQLNKMESKGKIC